MAEPEDELARVAELADQLANRIADAKFASALSSVEEAAQQAAKAWSGSWLGYHSRVYYERLQTPPAGARFDSTAGLYEEFGNNTRGKWVEFTFDDVYEALEKQASDPTLDTLLDLAREGTEQLAEYREQLLSMLTAVQQRGEDPYLDRLINGVENANPVSANEFIAHYRPKGQVLSSDDVAIHSGFQTPPHIAILSQIRAIRSPFTCAAEVAKLAHRAINHFRNRNNARAVKAPVGTNIFIGHGRSHAWRDLKDFLQDRLQLPWDEFNRVPIAGITNIARLSQMLDEAAIAFLVMTAEDEQKDGKLHARMNVVHEAGLFQGRLGFTRAIVLLEQGCEEFSNIEGLGQIRFPAGNIGAVFEEVRQVLEREGLLNAGDSV